MAVFKPFKALRPKPEFAKKVAALPYDVMSSEEARIVASERPLSFLHVDKAEIDLPEGTDLYSDAVYRKAADNLKKLEADGICTEDNEPHFYIYRQIMNGRAQTGLVGCASVDDYLNNVIKKHELTRAEKEADRIRHVDTCNANTGPIFLCYRDQKRVDEILKEITLHDAPVYDFESGGVKQTVWVIESEKTCATLSALLAETKAFYIADGHHRCASAVRVAESRRAQNPAYTGNEEFNFFLAVLFPESELTILDYNRVVRDLNGLSETEFFTRIAEDFDVSPIGKSSYQPTQKHTFGLYLDGQWYRLIAKNGTFDTGDPVKRLDVSILQNLLLTPVLGIGDPRTDSRIDFVGGIRGLAELEKRVNSGEMKLAFSMFPTTTDDLMAIADAGLIMPPKSTWFEPKLLSGLFIHKLG